MNAADSTAAELVPEASTSAEAKITLGMLNAVEGNSAVTQRSLARELGIALGLANTYLRRCVTKGLIKVSQAPAKRYAYYLTPKGFAEKGRLTAQYLTISFDFFRLARSQCRALFARCEENGWGRVALCGAGDLAEIAKLCAESHAVALAGLVDPDFPAASFGRLPVLRDAAALGDVDVLIITDHRAPQLTYDRLARDWPRERILAPALLNISRTAPKLAE